MAFFLFFISGCTHIISKDYDRYLKNNNGRHAFPYTNFKAKYLLTPNTVKHNYEFRSVTVGYAHLWVVNFGKILDQTLQSEDVQDAFKSLTRATVKDLTQSEDTIIIKFNLLNYKYEGFRAFITLEISLIKNKSVVFQKKYYAEGLSEKGKAFWGGSFAMKNAIQQSTKNALDQILEKFINDIIEFKMKKY